MLVRSYPLYLENFTILLIHTERSRLLLMGGTPRSETIKKYELAVPLQALSITSRYDFLYHTSLLNPGRNELEFL